MADQPHPEDKAAMDRFLAYVSKNHGPYGSISYWTASYLQGGDIYGRKGDPRNW